MADISLCTLHSAPAPGQHCKRPAVRWFVQVNGIGGVSSFCMYHSTGEEFEKWMRTSWREITYEEAIVEDVMSS